MKHKWTMKRSGATGGYGIFVDGVFWAYAIDKAIARRAIHWGTGRRAARYRKIDREYPW